MTKKKIIRFFKRYLLGLIVLYLLLAITAYIMLTKVSNIDYNEEIPQLVLENHLGESKTFSDYKGKVLLVDFWFQGCQPCLEEMKYFPELLKKYDSELAIMSISIDPEKRTKFLLENKPKPWDFLEADNENWTFYNDNMSDYSYVKQLGITSYPTYLLFDKEGNFINTPFSGVAAVENKLSGIFGLNLAYDLGKDTIKKLPVLIILYTVLVFIILFIQFLIYQLKRLFRKTKTNKL
ncbi:TlpA family protein disulfide reductase [Winogradskyella sp. UBA3174]|uniref:TlpA family protein disulfide reductase n=1 Tax=Winogradskyella sp. UBA3174 TaxID=1947785 RepID=UPI0025F76A08|nr:TlpA disulfide reductase family protein [Winogradskyella sp. UBA3174]|tara:strand:+ start:14210 stop:14917 length:708 start_codon:yes stop_codon:yes gene_type:complete